MPVSTRWRIARWSSVIVVWKQQFTAHHRQSEQRILGAGDSVCEETRLESTSAIVHWVQNGASSSLRLPQCLHSMCLPWETLKLLANGHTLKTRADGIKENQKHVRQIDLRWHDLRHEGARRLLADGVDIRIIQVMLGHASIQQTQRYLNVTDEELRRGLKVSWNNKGRPLRLASGA